MSALNSSHIPHVFLLMTVPGLESKYLWISFLLLCFMFLASITGNGLIFYVIIQDYRLHQPMFMFLAMLAVNDLLFTLVICPSELGIFLFHQQMIRSELCLLQMFFIHSLSISESFILVAMSFDRYLAICHPLRYTSILTTSVVTKVGLVAGFRGFILIVPPTSSLPFLPYCKGNILSYSYCVHQDVMRLACHGTNTFNIIYGLVVVLFTVILDVGLIFLSYVLIIRSILKATAVDRYKLFNTCIAHICAVFLFYFPFAALTIIHRFGKHLSPLLTNLIAKAYQFLPSMLNPIIYSIRSKHIREALYDVFHNRH